MIKYEVTITIQEEYKNLVEELKIYYEEERITKIVHLSQFWWNVTCFKYEEKPTIYREVHIKS